MPSQGSQPPQRPKYRYVDRPDVSETFADTIEHVFFDGQTLRLEFCVSRLDEPAPPAQPTGRRYPACRLVLSLSGALDLMNRMQQINAALTQAGILKVTPTQADGTQAAQDKSN
jgi:hypothetical protein